MLVPLIDCCPNAGSNLYGVGPPISDTFEHALIIFVPGAHIVTAGPLILFGLVTSVSLRILLSIFPTLNAPVAYGEGGL